MSKNLSPKERSKHPIARPEKNIPNQMNGIFTVGKNDIGYVTNKAHDVVYEIPRHEWNSSRHKDTVEITVLDHAKGLAKIEKVIHRAKTAFAGHVEWRDHHALFIPSDHKDPEIILADIQEKDIPNSDEKVIVVISRESQSGIFGHIQTVLGKAGTNDVEMSAFALERGFDHMFPSAVEAEAQELKNIGIPESERQARRDMRDILTFTIDPQDAKDFDDALSFQQLADGNWEIGIHIADVSFYVTPQSAIEEEAQRRTTSVYLVDRTIPMLPEVLSNDLCSLRENEEKLTYSAIFHIDTQGNVLDRWFGRTIIQSNKRFTYEEAQDIIDSGEGLYHGELLELNRLAKIYTQKRMDDGALTIDDTEVKFILDESGKPLRVQKKNRIDTNRLIEEFMLLANREVAEFLAEHTKTSISVYRVHDKPDEDRMFDLKNFLKSLGYIVHMKNGVIPPEELNALTREVKEDNVRSAIQSAIVRSMAKAIYSTENIGHYGLGFTYYTHFTSPIRRYPDVMVHRILTKVLKHEKISREEFELYAHMTTRSSARERDAQNAEWDSIAYKQVEYMSERIGQIFEGSITGMNGKGLFITEKETLASGFLRMKDIPGDYFDFHENDFIVKGRKFGKVYKIGDTVSVKVLKTDITKRQIDFGII